MALVAMEELPESWSVCQESGGAGGGAEGCIQWAVINHMVEGFRGGNAVRTSSSVGVGGDGQGVKSIDSQAALSDGAAVGGVVETQVGLRYIIVVMNR